MGGYNVAMGDFSIDQDSEADGKYLIYRLLTSKDEWVSSFIANEDIVETTPNTQK